MMPPYVASPPNLNYCKLLFMIKNQSFVYRNNYVKVAEIFGHLNNYFIYLLCNYNFQYIEIQSVI